MSRRRRAAILWMYKSARITRWTTRLARLDLGWILWPLSGYFNKKKTLGKFKRLFNRQVRVEVLQTMLPSSLFYETLTSPRLRWVHRQQLLYHIQGSKEQLNIDARNQRRNSVEFIEEATLQVSSPASANSISRWCLRQLVLLQTRTGHWPVSCTLETSHMAMGRKTSTQTAEPLPRTLH